MVRIALADFKVIARYIYELTGITLDESKTYLVENRLSSLLTELGCCNFREFCFKLKEPDPAIQTKVINAITTNETYFFRDISPFELLQHKILPDLIDKRASKNPKSLPVSIRIWSAACSTGQEVYSLAMVLKELLFDFKSYNIKILGTDLADAVISQASYGRYSKLEVERGLSPDYLRKYFMPLNENVWAIKDELRGVCVFKKLNLMNPFKTIGKFDIVLCRNVAIYFQKEDRVKLFQRISEIMEPDGYLIIGASETLSDIPIYEPKRYLRSIYYQLK